MAPTLPKNSDLPSTITIDIISPPLNQAPTNVLILFHGLGDTQAPFAQFARAMALPDTCAISIRAPSPLPFDLNGYHWGDDIVFDGGQEVPDVDAGFVKATKLITEEVIENSLVKKCGFAMRDIVLLGFGQGGMLALTVAKSLDQELSGVVSIGAGLSAGASRITDVEKKTNRSPVLVCKARDASAVTDEDADAVKKSFEFAEIKEWSRKGDGMPQSREEMLPIMQFFARRLRSRRGVPAGAVELT